MPPLRPGLLALIVLLAACGTPQERCIAEGTRDLRTLDRLIAETEGNIARGYAWEDRVVTRPRWIACEGQPRLAGEPPRLCLEEVAETERRPAAIDLAAERAKLAGMRDKRRELARAAERLAARCAAEFPQ
jgi:hypothetical protein